MKKQSPLSVALITTLITIIVCLIGGYFVLDNSLPKSIGDTVVEKIEIDGEPIVETGKTPITRTVTYVYLGACSKLYSSEDATTSCGIFFDTFESSQLAELIDSNAFPYKQEYVALTSSSNPARYMIKLENGTIYWVEP